MLLRNSHKKTNSGRQKEKLNLLLFYVFAGFREGCCFPIPLGTRFCFNQKLNNEE